MRWPWQKKPEVLKAPVYVKPEVKPLEPKDPAYVVDETEMSETGMFRLFPWRKKKDEPKE